MKYKLKSINVLAIIASSITFSNILHAQTPCILEIPDTTYIKTQRIPEPNSKFDPNISSLERSNTASNLKSYIDCIESNNFYNDIISDNTIELIDKINEIHTLALLENEFSNDINLPLLYKEKIIDLISTNINLKTKEQYSIYNYNTTNRKIIRFISVRSGNDLFTLGGLAGLMLGNKHPIKDNAFLIQRNDDRDYTGSLLIEIGSDLMSHFKRQPSLSYSTFFYGFDVYTPYFQDTAIFKTDTSFNPLDRPHATFQFFGYSKKGIFDNDKWTYVHKIKAGKIGGTIGPKFQNSIHQDISYSLRPKGWGAQIANGGRFGLNFETYYSFQPNCFLFNFREANEKKNLKFLRLAGSIFGEAKIGSYISSVSLGLKLSNRTFSQTNDNFISYHNKYKHTFMNSISYNLSYQINGIFHNTMLEGYGYFKTNESSDDPLTPKSLYYLPNSQVKRITHVLNINVSQTLKYVTWFYNWKSISPETKLADIGIKSPANNSNNLNIKGRWHHFAELGILYQF